MLKIVRILVIVPLILALVAAFQSCEKMPDVTAPSTTGTANFVSYVAIGNSITAGYQSNALFESAQQYSYPALIAKQVGIADFQQPLVTDPGMGGRIRVTSLAGGTPTLVYDPSSGIPKNLTLQRPYNNLGIPGSVLWIPNPQGLPLSDLFDSTDFGSKSAQRSNPFFQIILRNQAFGKTILRQAAALQPTFITFWLGNNDVLGYAASGGGWTNGMKILQPTPGAMFSALYANAAAALKQVNPNIQVVVANIPEVTSIPFFTTVPAYIINPQTGQPLLGADGRPVHWLGVNDGDLLTLRALDLTKQGYGVPAALGGRAVPLPDSVILDVSEQATCRTAVAAFNATIQTVAAQNGFGLVDANAVLAGLKTNGMIIAGQEFTSDYITGGVFSYDGVHPSARGQAIVANEFIKVINIKWNANIHYVDVMSLPGEPLGKRAVVKGLPNIPREVVERTIQMCQP